MFKLQNKINVNGVDYNIDTDFRKWIKFQNLIQTLKEDEESFEESFLEILSFFDEINLNFEIYFFEEALKNVLEFFTGEQKNGNAEGSNKKVFDFEKDKKYIYSAFLQEYNIDLFEIEYLHWHKFKSLIESLSDNCQLTKIIQYRSIDLSKIKDKEQKAFYQKMKSLHALEQPKKYDNLQEAEDDFLKQVHARFKQAEEKASK